MSIQDREAEGFSKDEAEWIEWRRANPGAIADGETRRALTRAFADIPEEKLEEMREAIRAEAVPKLRSIREVVEEIDRSVKRLSFPSNAAIIEGLAGIGLIGPRRIPKGTLSAKRMPIRPPAPTRLVSLAERPSLSGGGGSGEATVGERTEAPVSLEEEALERPFSAETVDPSRITSCYADVPPTPPHVPGFTRVLSAEGFTRWCKRMPLGDDPALNAHCVEARRRWHRYSVVLGRALDQLPWAFPTFAPHARPFDWAADL